ncbi:choice-of-anchor L domain-containing protein [Corynebacterium casei]|uniref:choice-of-anchor L domain-containing protein n=1 Tax=Corynebacterium casei TaxID=160386 RepID=UPI003BB52E84
MSPQPAQRRNWRVRITAIIFAFTLLIASSFSQTVPKAQAQTVPNSSDNEVVSTIENDLVNALGLPRSVIIAGQQLPTFPIIAGLLVGLPGLAALFAAIFPSSNSSSSSANGSSSASTDDDHDEYNDLPPIQTIVGDDGVTYNAQAKNIATEDASTLFGVNGVISFSGDFELTPEQITQFDVVQGTVYSVPPILGISDAGFILVENITELDNGNFVVATSEVGLDYVILDTNGPAQFKGSPDLSVINDTADISFDIVTPEQGYYAEESYNADMPVLDFNLEPKKFLNDSLVMSGNGSIDFGQATLDLDAGWRGIKHVNLSMTPKVKVNPEFEFTAETELPKTENHCNSAIKSWASLTALDKSIPVRFAAGPVVIWGNIDICMDIYATGSVESKASWKPVMAVESTIGGGIDHESDLENPYFILDPTPKITESKMGLKAADASLAFNASAGIDPNLVLKLYSVIGASGSLNTTLDSKAVISPNGTPLACTATAKFSPALSALFGLSLDATETEKKKIKNKFLKWLKFIEERQVPLIGGKIEFGPWEFCKTEAEEVTDDVADDSVQASNGKLSGSDVQIGYVEGLVEDESTWVLSTGKIDDVTRDPSVRASTNLRGPGDELLSEYAGYPTYDAVTYSVDIIPNTGTLAIDFVFASEEYPEYVGSKYNDVLAIFVDGKNCAFVPGTETPVSVNSINHLTNSQYYIDNSKGASGLNTVFDGVTTPLTCRVPVTPERKIEVKIMLADGSDRVWDSAVALVNGGIRSV